MVQQVADVTSGEHEVEHADVGQLERSIDECADHIDGKTKGRTCAAAPQQDCGGRRIEEGELRARAGHGGSPQAAHRGGEGRRWFGHPQSHHHECSGVLAQHPGGRRISSKGRSCRFKKAR